MLSDGLTHISKRYIQGAAEPTTFKIVIVTKLFQLQWRLKSNYTTNNTPFYFSERLVKITSG